MFSGLWNSWICGVVSTLVWDIHTNQLLQIFIVSFSSSSCRIPLKHMLYALWFSHSLWVFWVFLFSLFSSFWCFYWYSFNLTDFFSAVPSLLKNLSKISVPVTVFWFVVVVFDFFLDFSSVCLLYPCVLECSLFPLLLLLLSLFSRVRLCATP